MKKENLIDLISTIHPSFQARAIQQYIFELCNIDDLEKANEYFEKFCKLDELDDIKAENARLFACAYAFQNKFDDSLRIYGILCELGDNQKILCERIKTSHVIINLIMSFHSQSAFRIWQNLQIAHYQTF